MNTIYLVINILSIFFLSHSSDYKDHQLRVIPIGNKIALNPSMAINESVFGNASHLLDEQDIAGDPANGTGGLPKTNWFSKWVKKENFPVSAIIDLGYKHKISKIYLYYPKGNGSVSVSKGRPFQWKPIIKNDRTRAKTWKAFDVNDITRYLHIVTENIYGPGEIILYGEALMLEKPQPMDASLIREQPTFDEYVGVNAFIDSPIKLMKVAGFVREYHDWQWDEPNVLNDSNYKKDKIKWNPSYGGGNKWFFDEYYRKLNEHGITVAPCIQRNVKWLNGIEGKPIPAGADPLDPLSYAAHAFHLFQFAARYGSTKVPESRLALAEGQPKASGLDLIRYIENWNEQDNFWSTRENYFTPYEYAAMASADYDGHMKELGQRHGIKNADSNMKMVMGGLAKLNLDYIRCIKFWADHYRDGSMPLDVLNFHHYSHTEEPIKVGISPEEDKLFDRAKKLVNYRNKNFPDKEIWMTEFGYDTHPESPKRAPKIGHFSQEEVQGQWIIRSYLLMYAAGIDRAVQYMLRDVNEESSTQYSTSGLVSSKHTGKKPKPSWYYIYTIKNWLAGMKFSKDLSLGNVMIYQFEKADKSAYVIWSPTSKGIIVKNFRFPIESNNTMATYIELQDGKKYGDISYLTISNKTITNLTVTESPSIIVCDKKI